MSREHEKGFSTNLNNANQDITTTSKENSGDEVGLIIIINSMVWSASQFMANLYGNESQEMVSGLVSYQLILNIKGSNVQHGSSWEWHRLR